MILSLVLTSTVLFPDMTGGTIVAIILGGSGACLLGCIAYLLYRAPGRGTEREMVSHSERRTWRMPPPALLEAPKLSTARRTGLMVLRAYLLIAMILVIIRVIQLALGG
ncbi:hypothetical protein AB6813_11865 [bacterium RCC_150]